MRARVPVLVTLFWSLGCLSFPSQQAAMALDYVIDRPRVVAIRITPPLLVHGTPVTVDALVLAPGEAHVVSADICGLGRDLPTVVTEDACFRQPELAEHLADQVPFTWDPPDLSTVICPERIDTGGPYSSDTAWYGCASLVPLMITAKQGEDLAYGRVDAMLPVGNHGAIPAGIDAAPHTLDVAGEQVAGGEVQLTYTIDAQPDQNGFRWYVDGGVLLGTGRTAMATWDGTTAVTRNTLQIPDDWHGPLRVAVVTVASDAFELGHPGDVTWSVITLDIR
jgi:hypothetical protein